jgi:nitrate/nitrite-specific signal transduction histidine kinase
MDADRSERRRLAERLGGTTLDLLDEILDLLDRHPDPARVGPGSLQEPPNRWAEAVAAEERHLATGRALIQSAREGLARLHDDLSRFIGEEDTEAAVRRTVDELFGGVEGVDCSVTGSLYGLPPECSPALVRATREALTNARLHAAAHRVAVRLSTTHEGWQVKVRDDGIGVGQPTRAPGHIGLRAMSRRMASIGGQATVEAPPDGGTQVTLWVPRAKTT